MSSKPRNHDNHQPSHTYDIRNKVIPGQDGISFTRNALLYQAILVRLCTTTDEGVQQLVLLVLNRVH